MYKKHLAIFYERLKVYADLYDDKKENETNLKSLLDDINQSIYLQFYSELEAYLKILHSTSFNEIMLWIDSNKDRDFINEVMGTAFAFNKRARAFYRYYWIIRDYYNFENNLDFEDIRNLINKMKDAQMSKEEIKQALNAENFYFKFYSFAIDAYLTQVFKEEVKTLYKKA